MRDFKEIRVAVAGTGYVGLSIATLLSQHHHVTAVDVIPEKVEKLNNKVSPIQDDYIEKYLAEKPLDLVATLDGRSAYADADFVVIAAPTNYDPVKNYFDTSRVEEVIDLVLEVNPDAIMVIKSTIPVGYTRNLYVKYAQKGVRKFNLLFSESYHRRLSENHRPSGVCGRKQHDPFRHGCHYVTGSCQDICRSLAGRGCQRKHRYALHGHKRGGSSQAFRQHLPGSPCQLLQ